MEKEIWVGLYILLGIYILYRVLSTRVNHDREYEKIYDEVLNSEEYKVKGQYGK